MKFSEKRIKGKNGKIYTERKIVYLIYNDLTFLQRSILELYNRQTEDEKSVANTFHNNKRGFSASHGTFMSLCAEYILKEGKINAVHLPRVRSIMSTYRSQILDIIHEKAKQSKG